MLSNMSNNRGRQEYTSSRRGPVSQVAARPCALPQRFQPGPVPLAPPAFVPGLRWERSPYTCITLPDVPSAPSDIQGSEIRSPAIQPTGAAQPRLPPCIRVQPIALPAQIPGITAVTLNPVLRFSAGRTHLASGVEFDFAAVARAETAGDRNQRVLAQPATCPGLPSLTLISPLLPWATTAHASGGWVTVGDVLGAVHRALNIHVTEKQFNEWMEQPPVDSTSGQGIPGMPQKKARRDRSKTGDRTYRWGMKRLDLLNSRHSFAGLAESKMGCDAWIIYFV
ncbi:hypothetical protein DFH09DRAFT_1145461 [Mycena vulgaris]|nr:hypothetical protein DFH09DRAFT_1145461 [Mycena vulgaris]